MKKVDARGMVCPMPVIEAKKALAGMENDVLEVLVDNTMAVQNLTKLASYMNYPCSSEKLAENEFRVEFRVGEPALVEETRVEECIPDMRRAGRVVAISADHMGEGDDELGKLLLKGFVYALTELEQLPGTILLYNGGARLSVEGSDSLEDLKSLEAQGVEIMTCGTCLKHYGLSEKLSVGQVTNMYEIVEKLAGAYSVIRP